MPTSLPKHAGVEIDATSDAHGASRLDMWIALLGIAAILIAYTIREVVFRMHAAEIVTNLA